MSSSEVGLDGDERLLRALARGDADAVARLYEQHGPKMIAFARRYVTAPGVAEDIVAGLVQRWLERPPAIRDAERVAAFLATSVYHASIDWIRRDRAEQGLPPRHDDDEAAPDRRKRSPVHEPARGASLGGLQDKLRVGLEKLSQADRLLLEVHYGQALTPEECMAMLRISRPAFHQRLHRARLRLGRVLAITDEVGVQHEAAP